MIDVDQKDEQQVLQNSSGMLQSENLQKARGATRPGVSLFVAHLQIL